MPSKPLLSPATVQAITEARARKETYATIGKREGLSRHQVARVLKKVRTADEFQGVTAMSFRSPTRRQAPFAWSLESIRAARDDQMRGHFEQPVRLAEAMRTDDALFVAYHNRIAAQGAVEALIIPQKSTRGEKVERKMRTSVSVPRSVLEGIQGTMANHGLAIGYIVHEVDDLGTRVNMRLTEWPLEFVQWREHERLLKTRVLGGGEMVPIVHGDGRWIIFRKFFSLPWTEEACVLPGALIYAAHANGVSDWANASTSHGQAKMIGELPAGVSLQGPTAGTLSPEALAFLNMLQDVISGQSGVGIRPAGSATEFIANGSTAWQVFKELLINREKAAARIYLGTDAILGSVGGAPGVDISALFGVASTKIQGDFEAIERGLKTGLYEPWTAINFGDSVYAPRLEYQMPDPDEDKKSEENAAQLDRLLDALKKMRSEQMIVDQSTVDKLAASFKVEPIPQLSSGDDKVVQIELAPTDVARVTKVKEARAAKGLPPLGDSRDELFISELEAQTEGKVDAEVAVVEADVDAEADVEVAEAEADVAAEGQ
jgi:hypothetical protein